MRGILARVFVPVLLLALAAPAGAERKPYVFDKAHSQVNFVAEALLLTAHGYFERFDGDIQIDAEALENSAVRLEIETASINTRIEQRDNHLRSADFFDAANHPKITFVSKQVTRVDDKNLRLVGDLTIRGVTRTVEVPVFVVFVRDGRGRFKGEFKINRQDFGVSYNSRMNPIEDTVVVQFDINVVDKQVMEERQRQRQQQRQQQQQPPPPAQQKPPAL
jgi:polyisoprenoid-binding protein YceI